VDGSRRRVRLAVVALVLAAAAAGCGGDGGDDVPPIASPDTSENVKWAVDVCDQLSGWLRHLQDRGVPVIAQAEGAASPEEAKALLVGFLGETVAETDAVVEEIHALGNPEMAGGEVAAGRLRADLVPVREHVVRAHEAAAALPTNDPVAFAAGRDAVTASIREGGRLMRVAYANLENGEPRLLGMLASQEVQCSAIYVDGPNGPEPAPGFSI
jgi:hypothetical protein